MSEEHKRRSKLGLARGGWVPLERNMEKAGGGKVHQQSEDRGLKEEKEVLRQADKDPGSVRSRNCVKKGVLDGGLLGKGVEKIGNYLEGGAKKGK